MRYKIFFLGAVFLLIFAGISFAGEAKLHKAWTYYLKGDYEKAVGACRIISTDKVLGEEGYYIMGLSFLKLNRFQEARKNFEFVADNYKNSKITQEALLGIGDSYYLEGTYEQAEEYYKKLLRACPKGSYESMAYLRMGISQQRQGKWQEAESSLYKVIEGYPSSFEAKTASGCLKEKTDFFSVQAGAFSKKANAEKFCNLLKSKGYDAYIEKAYRNDRLMYCVKTGKFGTKQQAEDEAARLKGEGFSVRICS